MSMLFLKANRATFIVCATWQAMGANCCGNETPIDWADEVDEETIKLAFETYNTRFAAVIPENKMEWKAFKRRAKAGSYRDVYVSSLVGPKIEVGSRWKVEDLEEGRIFAGTPEGAYSNRNDIDTVKFFMTTTNIVNPIVLFKIVNRHFILLDGMNRIVASKLLSGLELAQVSVLIL